MPRRKGAPRPYQVTITRYTLPDGKRCTRDTPGAVKVTEKSRYFYADLREPRTALGTDDEQLAWEKMRNLLRQQREEDLGIRAPTDDHAARGIAAHLDDWLTVLKAKGTGEEQRATVKARLLRLFELAHWKKLPNITADSALVALATFHAEIPKGHKKHRSAQTRNHCLTHLKGFVGWAHTTGRATKNPVAGIRPLSVDADRRHERRPPTREEVAELLRHLASPMAPARMGMSGPQRALAYKVAMATGFRASEVRALTRDSFNLDASTASHTGRTTKNKRTVAQPLPAWLVTELREWFAAGGGLWDAFPEMHPGRLLRDDLDAARAEWIAAAGDDLEESKRRDADPAFLRYKIDGPAGVPLVVDFHALRVWFISELAEQPDMDIKTLMELARHSTPTLTLKVYARAKASKKQAAVNQLPAPEASLPPPPPPPAT